MSSENVRDLYEDSRAQMAQVVAGLVQGQSFVKISESTGISLTKIRRWTSEHNAAFYELLDDVEEAIIDHLNSQVVADVTASINALAPDAVGVLASVMKDPEASPANRMAAAAHVLRFSGQGKVKSTPAVGSPVEELLKGTQGAGSISPAVGD